MSDFCGVHAETMCESDGLSKVVHRDMKHDVHRILYLVVHFQTHDHLNSWSMSFP